MNQSYDFQSLAKKYTYLKQFLDDDGHYDFKHQGLCQLTKAILKEAFDLVVELRDDRLCPTIPSRLEYLNIINQVLKDCALRDGDVQGLDIGTGAYAIYSILGSKKYNWKMIGSDTDAEAINNALKVIESNQLKNVVIIDASNDPDLFFTHTGSQHITFTMCNPPFFTSRKEMLENSSFKEKLDRGSVIASDNELVTTGGEVEFVTRMIVQSVQFPEINWFSSLLGKKSSIDPLLNKLLELEIQNFFIRSYQMGQTKRWIIFWSFQYKRPRVDNEFKKIDPTVIKFDIDLDKVELVLKDLPLKFSRHGHGDEIVVESNGDVWSRSFRRKKQKPNVEDKSIFKVSSSGIYWSYGSSVKIFQSFHTYIRKHL